MVFALLASKVQTDNNLGSNINNPAIFLTRFYQVASTTILFYQSKITLGDSCHMFIYQSQKCKTHLSSTYIVTKWYGAKLGPIIVCQNTNFLVCQQIVKNSAKFPVIKLRTNYTQKCFTIDTFECIFLVHPIWKIMMILFNVIPQQTLVTNLKVTMVTIKSVRKYCLQTKKNALTLYAIG